MEAWASAGVALAIALVGGVMGYARLQAQVSDLEGEVETLRRKTDGIFKSLTDIKVALARLQEGQAHILDRLDRDEKV